MSFPVDTKTHDLTSGFGPRKPFLVNGRLTAPFHYGLDFAPEARGTLTSTHAIRDGIVTSVGTKLDAGRNVIVYFPSIRKWGRYCHLSGYSVRAGQRVEDAQYLGRIGATGKASGVHLHFELYSDAALTTRIDPTPYIWTEKSPTEYAINGGKPPVSAPVPPQPANPVPAPVTKNSDLKLGVESLLSLTRWRGYTTSSLTTRQDELLDGHYRVIGIASNGNLKVKGTGNGRESWVYKSAGEGVIPEPTPAPAPTPTPVTESVPPRIGYEIDLKKPWHAYRYNTLVHDIGLLEPGRYSIRGIINGHLNLRGPGGSGWVHSSAAKSPNIIHRR